MQAKCCDELLLQDYFMGNQQQNALQHRLRRTLVHFKFDISDFKSPIRNSKAEVCDATMLPLALLPVTKKLL
ncbi:MAG: hypothetical protein EAZ16_06305 [Sphingobacteriales bacterium]|nr:MAG: hypothetical protein EAZ16_06305 [Sphingobacteriales bacterium]